MKIEKEISAIRREQRMLKQAATLLEQYYSDVPDKSQPEAKGKLLSEKMLRKKLRSIKYIETVEDPIPSHDEIVSLCSKARSLTALINDKKDSLRAIMDTFTGTREFRSEFIRDSNIISIFDSALTRTLGIAHDTLTHDLIIVKTCYFKILQDIILNGFYLSGEKYVIYTASAGQIRTKRSVFILERRLQECAPRLMCGLTVDRINKMGGVNINKYLAYLALSNSATDEWAGFDINRCIVVDDMETDVLGTVDYIDRATYEITRREMHVPIAHTDGAGMVRPDICKKNFMIRLPWVKGLLASFPFDKFVREANRAEPSVNHGVIKDIYGTQHDILAEDIQIIFTKSQFKMWKYYNSWQEYCENFKLYHCSANICNMEESRFESAKINYQMLQTLSDLSDIELAELASSTRQKLERLSYDRNTMLQVFGATPSNRRMNAFQEALMIYPELLQDEYSRDTLRLIKLKIEKEARAGRLDIAGMYTFVIPDMYAFCQWLFLEDKNPAGLLSDGEVYCNLFASGVELDCLRSPHLYREHAVRKNVNGISDEVKRWFITNGIYISCHDLISKVLQCDWDGDKLLVCSDPVLITAAKRNCADIVPLYYEMLKAGAREITPSAIYESMIAAYTGGNIGQISNDITKVWNSGGNISLDAVKLMAFENNFIIDYAKTLFKPTRPEHADILIRHYTSGKVPYFFIEAKGKTDSQVAEINDSCVNRIRTILPQIRLNFNKQSLGKFDWKMLVKSSIIPNNDITEKIISTYKARSSRINFNFCDENDDTNKRYICQHLREELLSIYADADFVCDVLVKHLFYKTKSRRKVVFWECFGREVVKHLNRNINKNTAMCIYCGARFYKESPRQVMCPSCSKKRRRALKTANDRSRRAKLRTL